MPDLTGRVALVTGGSRGIGAAIAVHLARAGADVAITYQRQQGAAARVVESVRQCGRRGLAIAADAADPVAARSAVQQTVDELGRLDVLVNNAGAFPHGPFEQASLEEFDTTFAVNVRAPFLAAQAASTHLSEGGRIVMIGSDLAERAAFPGIALYAGSKSALVGLAKGLARELGPRGITVNVVHPGSTETDMNPVDGPNSDVQRSFIALGHYGAGADVAAMVTHLAGPAGRYVTGASIAVDGGFTA